MFVQLPVGICKKNGVKLDNEPRYKYIPKLVEKFHESTPIILQNQRLQTDRAIPYYEQDVIKCKCKDKVHRCTGTEVL